MKDESRDSNVISIAGFAGDHLPRLKTAKNDQQDADCEEPAKKMMLGYTRSPGGNIMVDEAEGDGKVVCSDIRCIENVTDTRTGKVYVRSEFKDHQNRRKTILVPRAELVGSPSRLIERLSNAGFCIQNRLLAKQFLSELYQFEPPERNIEIVSNPGWHAISDGNRKVFVISDETFKPVGAFCNMVLDGAVSAVCSSKGTLSDWQENVAKPCHGNARLMLLLSASASGPLLDILGYHNFGLHVLGPSRAGKTTGLIVAGSFYGDGQFRSSWNATTNALQETAISRNDMVLLLDEISQCDAKQASAAVYDLMNGVTKGRLSSEIKLNAGTRFRVVVISTGEDSLQEHLQQGGVNVKAGQLARLFSIPVHPKHGMFRNLHGHATPGDFAAELLKSADTYYGTAGSAFISYLANNQSRLRKKLPAQVQEIEKPLLACLSTDKPIALQRSVAKSMAVIACAGELAIVSGIFPWQKGDAIKAAKICFKAWNQYEQEAELERNPALASLKQFFHDNQSSLLPLERYSVASNLPVYTHIVDGTLAFLVSPEYFERTLCRHFGKKSGLEALKKHGLLVPNSRGGPTRQVTIPKNPKLVKPGFYVIRSTILTDD